MSVPANRLGLHAEDGRLLAFLTSLVAHVGLLLVLACCVVVLGAPSSGIVLQAPSGQVDPPEVLLQQVAAPRPEPAAVSDLAADAARPESAMNFALDVLRDVPLEMGWQPPAQVASVDLTAVGDRASDRSAASGATFFGTYATGSRFVFVLDSSRSMSGERWLLARQKLLQSLRQMGSDQQFFVMCFDWQTSLLFNCQPTAIEYQRADSTTIRRVERWLKSRTLGPATMPAEALQLALAMQPDAIFLLSDGELHDHSLHMLRIANGRDARQSQIPIHVVHLVSPEGRKTLEQLARENGGTFAYISDSRSLK